MAEKKAKTKEAKAIRITCSAAGFEPLSELSEFQRKFKNLHEPERKKLKLQLLKLGICEPFVVWKDAKGKKNLIDGHQRLQVLREMLKSGEGSLMTIGDSKNAVPVVYAQPRDAEEAVRMVLALASTYGRVDIANLGKFRGVYGVTEKEFQESFSFPELDIPAQAQEGPEEKVEFNAKKEKLVKCPKCEHIFDAKKHKAEKAKK